MPQPLCFNDVQFDVIPQNSQPWIRGSQIATALQYASVQRVIELYTRHADEFTDAMTAVIKLPSEGGEQETRIFSLRGCHLLAMFARTPVAKAFRKWVLDVLDRLAAEERAALPEVPHFTITPSTPASRKPLRSLVNAWARISGQHQETLWPQVKAHFQLERIDDLPEEWIPDALEWVQGKIDAPGNPVSPALSNRKQGRLALADMAPEHRDALEQIERLIISLRQACYPGAKTMKQSPDAREMRGILFALYATAADNLHAAYNAVEAGYKLGRLYGRG